MVVYSSQPPSFTRNPPFPSIRQGPTSIIRPSKEEQPGPPWASSAIKVTWMRYIAYIEPEHYSLLVRCPSILHHYEKQVSEDLHGWGPSMGSGIWEKISGIYCEGVVRVLVYIGQRGHVEGCGRWNWPRELREIKKIEMGSYCRWERSRQVSKMRGAQRPPTETWVAQSTSGFKGQWWAALSVSLLCRFVSRRRWPWSWL